MKDTLALSPASLVASTTSRLRWGLCCQFTNEPIRFRTTTATALLRLSLEERRLKLSDLCLANAQALLAALQYCHHQGIGSFRIGSSILPIKTHPDAGYHIADLPNADGIIALFRQSGTFAAAHHIRTVFHPDQFVVLNSPRADVVTHAIQDLEYHAEVAAWVGADVINIHGGGGYGDTVAAVARFGRTLDRLSDAVRSRLTVENDDTVFTPADLLPMCRAAGVPLVYDVHHHRCLPDRLSVEDATQAAMATWNREPLFHVSSPKHGWGGATPKRHHDYIDPGDVPSCWHAVTATVEVEAKAKEVAVLRLMRDVMPREVTA